MKREELIEYKADENFGNGLVYSILEVNKVLDEKDAEIAALKAKIERLIEFKDKYSRCAEKAIDTIARLELKIRRLSRALYRVLALWANERARLTWSWRKEQGWLKMERKCHAMAEKFK